MSGRHADLRAEFNEERFVDWCMEHFVRFKPLHEWLNERVMGAVHA